MELSDLTRVVSPTLSRQLFMKAKLFPDVIDFTLGDPDIPTPEAINQAATHAAMKGLTHYSPNAGLPVLRELISRQVSKESGLAFSANNVAVTIGATEAVFLSFMACINPGDEVIILAPYWVQYENIVKLLGGKPVIIDTFKEEFEPDLNVIDKAITDKTKVIIVNSPNNPSGYIYNDCFLKDLAKKASDNNIIIFDDEAYRSLVYEMHFPSIANYTGKEDIVIINSFSKQFAMTGWRVGYVVADERIINSVVTFQQNLAVCVATPNQYAAIEAMNHADMYASEIRDVFSRRRMTLVKELEKINEISFTIPQGTFYAFLDISKTGMDSKSFCFSLLEREHIATIPGVAFGEAFDSYIRLAFTINEERIIEGVRRLSSFISMNK